MKRSLDIIVAGVAAVLFMGMPGFSASTDRQNGAAALQRLRAQLVVALPGLKPEDIQPTAHPGLFEVNSGDQLTYVTSDGKYLLNGDLFEIDGKRNLSELRRNAARLALLSELRPEDVISFAPPAPTHTVTAFVDVDCSFCRKLQNDMAELNQRGIAIRFVAYPRTGPDTKSWEKMQAVWCSGDPKDAFARAMAGEALPAGKCRTPVGEQYDLGNRLGVDGTPTFVTDTGALIVGYSSVAQLAARVTGSASLAAAAPVANVAK